MQSKAQVGKLIGLVVASCCITFLVTRNAMHRAQVRRAELLSQNADRGLEFIVGSREPRVEESVTKLWISALQSEDDVAMRRLIEEGQPVNGYTRNNGLTPLLFAVRLRDVTKARVLLDQGADPNQVTASGMTPLGEAASKSDTAVCELLLRHGARPEIGTYSDFCLCQETFKAGRTRIAGVLQRFCTRCQVSGRFLVK